MLHERVTLTLIYQDIIDRNKIPEETFGILLQIATINNHNRDQQHFCGQKQIEATIKMANVHDKLNSKLTIINEMTIHTSTIRTKDL